MYSNGQRYIPDRKPPIGALLNPYLLINRGLVLNSIMWEGGGNTVEDLSGNGNTVTFGGTAPSWTSGKFGSAVLLPGTDEYIGCPEIALGYIHTLSWWWQYNVDRVTILFSVDAAAADYGYYCAGNQIADACYYRPAGGFGVSLSHGGLIANIWYHMLIVRNGDDVYLYINGVLQASNNGLGTRTLTITQITNSIDLLGGKFDIPMIWVGYALSSSEIALLCREPFSGFRWESEQLISFYELPPEIQALYMDLSTQIWTIKHSQGLFAKL